MDDNPFRRRLLSGERLLWIGAPGRGLLFRSQDLFAIPFSLFWCGFSIFWVYTASRAEGFFALFGVPFVVIGLFLVFGRFIADAWLRRRTVYAVTDRRILIQREALFGAFTSHDLVRLPEVTLTDERAARGTLRFGPAFTLSQGRSMSAWMPTLDQVPQFIAVDDAADVLRLILEATDAARAAEKR